MKLRSNVLLFSVLITGLVVFSSCSKRKEQKAWESTFGNYSTQDSIFMCEFDNGYQLYANQLILDEDGILLVSTRPDDYGSSFKKVVGTDNSNYDYQLVFSKTILFQMNSAYELEEQPSLPFSALNDGRKFYLKVGDSNQMSFIVAYDDGTIEIHHFNK